MTPYLLLFAAGFAGSFHCIGMCGGFACAVGGGRPGEPASLARPLSYNVGRLTTYCFLGALAGAFGQAICADDTIATAPLFGGALDTTQRLLAAGAGVLMLVMGLQMLGLMRRSAPLFLSPAGNLGAAATGSGLAGTLRSVLQAPGVAAPLAFGVFNGFLPCPLVYAFVAQAASTASAGAGIATMAAFGLGTFPAMLAMGRLGRVLGRPGRQIGVRIAAGFILALGLLTLLRGILPPTLLHGLAQ